MSRSSISSATLPLLAGVAAIALSACAKTDKAPADSAAMTANAPPAAAPADTTHSGMAAMPMMNMTGDPDRDFLRMMSDHHKGLTAMAHEAVQSKDKLTVKDLATSMDAKQDKELDMMGKMLEADYKDVYAPMIMPDNQTMIDALKGKTGPDFDRTFLQNVITHHQQAVKMVDDYLPKAKAAKVKSMAEKMKADQTKELAVVQARLTKLGGK